MFLWPAFVTAALQAGLFVADKVTGPYTFIKALRINDDNNRDSTFYRDDDTGKAYFIYSGGDNSHLDIAELRDLSVFNGTKTPAASSVR